MGKGDPGGRGLLGKGDQGGGIREGSGGGYFLESRPSSTKAVTIRKSGNSSLNAAIPSGAQIKFKKRILDSGMPGISARRGGGMGGRGQGTRVKGGTRDRGYPLIIAL